MFLPAEQLFLGCRDSGVSAAGEGGRFFRSTSKGRSGGAREFRGGGECVGRDCLRRADLEMLIPELFLKCGGGRSIAIHRRY